MWTKYVSLVGWEAFIEWRGPTRGDTFIYWRWELGALLFWWGHLHVIISPTGEKLRNARENDEEGAESSAGFQ